MGTKIKPVQPTVIKDKAIIRQVIQEIHRCPSPDRLAKMDKDADSFFAKVVRK